MPQNSNKSKVIIAAIAICFLAATQFVPTSYFMVAVGISILVMGIVARIFQVVLKRKNTDGSKPSPFAQKAHQFQDERENVGWRIEMIPFDDPFKPMMLQSSAFASVGALALLIGFILLAYNANKYKMIAVWLVAGGLLMALFGLWFKARKIRKNWEFVTAHCVDCELKKPGFLTRKPKFMNGLGAGV